jgi:transforming growth factor-beta-induced protein
MFFVLIAAGAMVLPAPALLAGGSCGGCPAGAVATMDIVDTAVSAGKFNTLVTAVKAAGLVDVLKGDGPFTVFAPADEAFARLPEGTVEGLLKDTAALKAVLTYHVVPGKLMAADVLKSTFLATAGGQSLYVNLSGDEVRVDGARIVKTDIAAKNGVIHVIDAVVLPRKNIVETAADAGTFKTLLAAAQAASLAETLSNGGPFTVFAPSDEAFAKLPAGTVEGLLADKAKLTAVLLHHVLPGRTLSGSLAMGDTRVETAGKTAFVLSRSADGSVRAGSARVVAADVLAGNGVIHVIDSVILP